MGQKCGNLTHKHNCRIASVDGSIQENADSLIFNNLELKAQNNNFFDVVFCYIDFCSI